MTSAQRFFGNPYIPELIDGILIVCAPRRFAISKELTRQLARRSLEFYLDCWFQTGPTAWIKYLQFYILPAEVKIQHPVGTSPY